MHVQHVAIRNFRALADIDCDLSSRVNVIVGPNAVGKTTILQAIRVVKAILAPRTPNEAQQVLISLSAASPHFPQRVFLNSLAREPTQQIAVRCTYALTDDEIAVLRASLPQVTQNVVAARAGQNFANPAGLIHFLQSPQGKSESAAAKAELESALAQLEREKTLVLGVTLDGAKGQIVPSDPLGGPLIGFLDQRLPPLTSIFSYFPADRALPMGEVNLQVGGPDAQQQMESHNSQPQMKYARLKNLIINSLMVEDDDRQTVRDEFELIFSGLLKSRRIKTIRVNELGLLSVVTEDVATGRLIELDSLSSGEKNIALTFLIVARSVAKGGIALFDEPELHLSPAVSRDLLSFMMDKYSTPRDIQFIMCTHSPEILAGAFSNNDCTLLHLKSASDITRVGKNALDEYADALLRLGISVSESLLYEGTVLVEGDDDVAFLENGFSDILKKFKVKGRGGRREVEKSVRDIQALEEKGQKVAPMLVIFDRDEEPTTLTNSAAVKILQWPRRCVENYMIDVDIIAELLKDSAFTNAPIASEGEVHRLVRALAYRQLDVIVARETYNAYGYASPSLQKADLKEGDISKLARDLFARMANARASIPETPKDAWINAFQESATKRRNTLLLTWEAKWRELCDGKKLISDLHKAASLKMSETSFKALITRRMRERSSETWQKVRDLLQDLVHPTA